MFNIRNIVDTDVDDVYGFVCLLENEILEKGFFSKTFMENIRCGNNVYLMVCYHHQSVGFIACNGQTLLHHTGMVFEIQEFYIISSFRNKGIGRLLFGKILEFADQNKLKSIEVTTNKKRIENIAIYENLGFGLTHNKFTIYK